MPGRGVLFALERGDEQHLLALPDARARVAWTANELEERWDTDWLIAVDKQWFPVHFCLNGSAEFPLSGAPPEAKVIFGGRPLGVPSLYSIDYKDAEMVRLIAQALGLMREDAVWARAGLIERKEYDGPKGSNIQVGVVEAIQGLAAFYRRAADVARAVIFTVDM